MKGHLPIKKIGIFAGTFDPVHAGHIAFAEAALKSGLDKVFLLVEPRPRRKQGVRALEHRNAMASLAVKHHPGLGVVQLEQAKFSPSETLPLLQARFKGSRLVLLFGDDVVRHMIDHLTDWPHIEELAKTTSLLIATRHHDQAAIDTHLKDLRRYGLAFDYAFIEKGGDYLSSSQIRQAIRVGKVPDDLDPAVARYIAKNGLYASSESVK